MNYLTFFVLPFTFSLAESDLKKCFYVSSYHQGYAWSDSIEKELKNTLKDFCELKQFNMDTKRNTAEEFVKTSALKAKSIIEEWQPDILMIFLNHSATDRTRIKLSKSQGNNNRLICRQWCRSFGKAAIRSQIVRINFCNISVIGES